MVNKNHKAVDRKEEPIQTLTYKPTIFKEQIMQRGCMIQSQRKCSMEDQEE